MFGLLPRFWKQERASPLQGTYRGLIWFEWSGEYELWQETAHPKRTWELRLYSGIIERLSAGGKVFDEVEVAELRATLYVDFLSAISIRTKEKIGYVLYEGALDIWYVR